MPAKITGLTLDYRSCCPKVTVVGQTSLLSCRKARKARIFTSDWDPSGESRFDARNRCAAGAYELIAAEGGPAEVSLFASGSELALAVEARKLLVTRKIRARIVSVPGFELLFALPEAERAAVIGAAKVNVAVEAGIRQGWDAIIGSAGTFVGMTGFGASAPYKDLYRHFGLTAQKVAEAASSKV